MTNNKKDLLLVAIILAIAAAGFAVNYRMNQKPAAVLEISIDGAVAHTLDLNTNTEMVIDGYHGGTNHLIIEDGLVWVDQATCPDKVCIHQGRVALNGQMIVCLPNRMVAKIIAPES